MVSGISCSPGMCATGLAGMKSNRRAFSFRKRNSRRGGLSILPLPFPELARRQPRITPALDNVPLPAPPDTLALAHFLSSVRRRCSGANTSAFSAPRMLQGSRYSLLSRMHLPHGQLRIPLAPRIVPAIHVDKRHSQALTRMRTRKTFHPKRKVWEDSFLSPSLGVCVVHRFLISHRLPARTPDSLRPSHLECFLRPLKGWTGGGGMGGGREVGGGGVPVVLVAPDVSKLASALEVVDKNGFINTREVCVCVFCLECRLFSAVPCAVFSRWTCWILEVGWNGRRMGSRPDACSRRYG